MTSILNGYGPVGWEAAEYTDCISAVGYDHPNVYPAYDTKQSDCDARVIPELWGMRSTLSLLSLPGPLQPEW